MIPFLRRGEYDVFVNGSRVGMMRSAQQQAWFLGPAFAQGAPNTFTVRRTGGVTPKATWKQSVQSRGGAFGVGWVLEPKGPVPPRLTPGGGLGGVASIRGGSGSNLQIDPGVVLVWSGGSVRGTVPDAGLGVAFDAGGVRNEVFVPYQGQPKRSEITVNQAHRLSNRSLAESKFKELAQNINLDYAAGGRFEAKRYTNVGAFWSAV